MVEAEVVGNIVEVGVVVVGVASDAIKLSLAVQQLGGISTGFSNDID